MLIFRTFLMNRNGKWIFLLLSFAGMIVSALLGICIGSNRISLPEIITVFLNREADSSLYRIIITLRIPRVTAALLAGSALSVSGGILQSVLDNPLASPNIIGVNSGAGFFVLFAMAVLPSVPGVLPAAAFLGAFFAAMLVLVISMRSRGSRLVLILTGFAVNSMFNAGMNGILILYPDAYTGAGNFLTGGLSAVTGENIKIPAAFILTGLISSIFCGNGLNLLNLGSERARTLGMNIMIHRCLYIMVAAVLAGAAVSFAGLLGFVGLMIPHIVKLILGPDNRFLLPASAFWGGIFVVLCDLLARTLFCPYELPVGILMAFLGSPFFLFLILKNRHKMLQ